MGLDCLRGSAHGTGLDHVGIERALYEKFNFAFELLDAVSFLFEDGDEFIADDLAFRLGISHALELSQETFRSIHSDQMQT